MATGVLAIVGGTVLWVTSEDTKDLRNNIAVIAATFAINAAASVSRGMMKRIPTILRYGSLATILGVTLGIGFSSLGNSTLGKICLITGTIATLTGFTTVKTQLKKIGLGKLMGTGDEIFTEVNKQTVKRALIGNW